MDILAIATLLVLLLVKEAGVPIPVPGDLLVLGAGVASAGQPILAVGLLLAILIAGFIGGTIQFALVRGSLRHMILAVLERVGVGRSRLHALAARIAHAGTRGVAVSRATPGVRIAAIAACGLAGLRYAVFLPGLILGNTAFVGGHFALGFVVGAPALAIAASFGSAAVAVILFAALAVAGALGWRALARRRAPAAAQAQRGSVVARTSTWGDWADAACPVCLGIALIGAAPAGD